MEKLLKILIKFKFVFIFCIFMSISSFFYFKLNIHPFLIFITQFFVLIFLVLFIICFSKVVNTIIYCKQKIDEIEKNIKQKSQKRKIINKEENGNRSNKK